MSSLLEAIAAGKNQGVALSVGVEKGTSSPGGAAVTYSELVGGVKKIAESGIVPVNTILSTCMGNTVAHALVFLAVGAAGSAIAPINPDSSENEMEFFLKRSSGGLVVAEGTETSLAVITARRIGINIYFASLGEGNELVLRVEPPLTPLHSAIVSPVIPSSTCLILFTSGTTGQPKSVPLSHANLIASAKNIVATYALDASDVTYAVMPFFHIHGLVASLVATLLSGGQVVMPEREKFSVHKFFSELTSNKCTWYTAVPTIHHIVLESAERRELLEDHSLRFIRSCSASLAPSLLHALEAKFKVPVLEAYAMTEAAHQMTSNPLRAERKPGTVGLPQGSVWIRIVGGDMRQLENGQRGEICVKGPNVTSGYLNNPQANKESFIADGFFRTGDEGFLDQQGYLTITGRIKELINKGGEKISPIEIDSAVLTVPGIAEAVSFGVPDTKYGEVVGVAVILREGSSVTPEDIVNALKPQIASFKLPSKIYIVKALPRTATGKIQRRIVAQHCISTASKL